MLDQASHIFLITAADSVAVSVFGPAPTAAELAELADLRQDKPTARRFGDGSVFSVPVDGARWCIWLLPVVPKVSELAGLLARAQAISLGFAQIAPRAPATENGMTDAVARLAGRMTRPTKNLAALVSVLGEQLVEEGQARALAVLATGSGKIWLSDQSLAPQKQTLLAMMAGLAKTPAPFRLIRADGTDPDELEARLILSATGHSSLWIGPTDGNPRYVAALFDPVLPLRGLATGLGSILQIARPIAPPLTQEKRRQRRIAAFAAAGVLALVLLWPVPQKITVTGTAVPADMTVAALPTEAVLVSMAVRVGDMVTAGQEIAQFRSQALAEQQAQETLNMTVEELNAQAAMAKNDYGAYQISAQRYEIAKARLAQIEARMAQLVVTAPVAGRIVSALPQNATGASHPTGTQVAAVQQGDGFLMQLAPSRVDARRIQTGMQGRVYFRGLSGHDFAVEVLTPPAVVASSDGSSEMIESIASVSGEDTNLIMSGLAGYARLDGPRAPRIVGMTHYILEYLRVQAWTYLGLRL